MADVLIPLAAQTNAIVVCEAGAYTRPLEHFLWDRGYPWVLRGDYGVCVTETAQVELKSGRVQAPGARRCARRACCPPACAACWPWAAPRQDAAMTKCVKPLTFVDA